MRPGEASPYGHLQGGPTTDPGAKCQLCHRPLLRIWQLDCSDPRLVKAGTQEPAFAGLTTLPLYYCWQCGGEYAYRVKPDGTVDVLESKLFGGAPGDDFPYPNYPSHFPQQPIQLYRPDDLPEIVRKYLFEDPPGMFDSIPEEHAQQLADFLHHQAITGYDITGHQLGGIPPMAQGEEENICPNPDCPKTKRQKRRQPMKVLAAAFNDPPAGLPVIEPLEDGRHRYNFGVQLLFHLCDACFTVHSCNRCD